MGTPLWGPKSWVFLVLLFLGLGFGFGLPIRVQNLWFWTQVQDPRFLPWIQEKFLENLGSLILDLDIFGSKISALDPRKKIG